MSSSTLPIYWKRIRGTLSPSFLNDTVDCDMFGGVWFDGEGPPGSIPEARPNDYYLDRNTGKIYKLYPD